MPSQIYYEMRINYVYYWLWHKEGIREEFINCGSSLKLYGTNFLLIQVHVYCI